MNRYLYLLFMWLCSLSVFAQTEGYDPTNPPLPDFPSDDPSDSAYTLVVNSSPLGSGSLNTSGGSCQEGSSVYLRAYNNGSFYFMYWIDDEGNTLSTSSSFYFTMPKRDAVVTAVYQYSPSNPTLPELPDTDVPTYMLTLSTKPAGAGSFNISSTDLKEAESIHLYAYTSSNFFFKHWEDAEGNIISTAQNFYYSMPAEDTQLYGIYTYNPSNPSNPGKNYYDSFTGEVIIDDFTRGYLSSAIYEVTNGNTSNITSITVAGVVNSSDFSIANNYSACTIVDLSRTSGITTVPSYCYDGNTHLNRLSLPACITNIEYRAFRNATALTELTCHATVPPTLGSYVFSGINSGLVVYVPASSIEIYENAAGWRDYVADGTIVIMPIMSQVSSLEINLPTECADGRYKNMPLELLNVKSGQKFKYVITDRINYTFSNLVNGTRYVATLKNLSGQALAKTDTISIEANDVSVTFDLASMKQLRSVNATILTADGNDVSAGCTVTWYDANGTFLVQNQSLTGQISETKVKCAVSLPQSLALEYAMPADSIYEVLEDDNNIVFTLAELPKVQISGRVLDVTTLQAVSNATITVSQTLNGKYSKSFSAKTDKKGEYSLTVFVAPTSVTYAADDYVSQTKEFEERNLSQESCSLADTHLKPITGATITTNFSFTKSVAEGVEPEILNFYSDYNNVTYNIYNVTTEKDISQFNVQYPNIVLLEEVSEGDSLTVVAMSKNGSFKDIITGGHIDSSLRMSIDVPVVQWGGVDATFTTTENSRVLGILYDSKGTFVNKYNYGTATLSIRELKDGDYTLVTMGASDFFSSINNLEKFSEAGLQQNIDYLVNKMTVKSGIISPLKNVLVPFFDESKFYYTGDNTSFTVNKTSIVAGNYLTLTAKVDFKDVYKNSISDVKVSVELPEGTSMVDNSVMVGSSVAYYELNGNTLTIPLDNNVLSDRIRFCVIPTSEGFSSMSASVGFLIGEKNISQPIGTVNYIVRNLAISVPKLIIQPEFVISGLAPSRSDVVIYDGSEVLAQTTALANGFWSVNCELKNPYNLSNHYISAKIVSKEGLMLQTETKTMMYNSDAVDVKTVVMSFYNGWLKKNVEVEFDFRTNTTSSNSYMFYTGTDITFTVDLSNNDPERVKDVFVYVYTDKNEVRKLRAVYNEKLNRWVAVSRFESNNLPVNVNVTFDATSEMRIDVNQLKERAEEFIELGQQYAEAMAMLNSLFDNYLTDDLDYDKLSDIAIQLGLDFVIPSDVDDEETDLPDVDDLESFLDAEYERMRAENDQLISAIDVYSKSFEIKSQLDLALENLQYSISDCSGIEESTLEELGYTKLLMTDNSYVYVLMTSTTLEYVDFARNIHISIVLNAEMQALVMSSANGESWHATVRSVWDKIDSAISQINELCNNLTELAKHPIEELDKAIKDIERQIVNVQRYKLMSKRFGKVSVWTLEEIRLQKALGAVRIARRIAGPLVSRLLKCLPVASYLATLYDCYHKASEIDAMYRSIPNPCPNDQAQADACKASCTILLVSVGAFAIADVLGNFTSDAQIIGGAIGSFATAGTSLVTVGTGIVQKIAVQIGKFLLDVAKEFATENLKKEIKKLKCKPEDDDDEDDDEDDDDDPPFDPINPIHDPSGYVYEGVSSNRLAGVTATAYYKEVVEDMYGDLHENIVLWDAEEYAQKNPLFTDENGMYQWDVPQGLWQVRFEKEGYVATQSEWLPVPPPQMDVNIGMVQNAQPEVISARAYEDGVEIEFSKYMNIESLNNENIFVKVVNGDEESLIENLEILMLNSEATIEGSDMEYASKVKLATDQLGYYDEAYVIISTGVNSYAGIPMAHTFEQKLDVEKKVRELLVTPEFNVEYNGQKVVTIAAIPADAAVGKTLSIESVSDMIATTDVTEVTFDADGQATFTVMGELFGATALNYSLVDADLKATSLINVVDPSKLAAVKTPSASRISGTAVYRGQTVALSCESEGATIYYTLDGSCPCDETERMKYDHPIVISDAMTIKFMAVGTNFDESEVVECSYSIRQSDVKLNLAKGWNWNSHDVASPVNVSEFSGIASRVLTQTQEAIDDPVLGFVGTLTSIDGVETMKIEAKESAMKSFVGEQYNPAQTPITLYAGWNWLGYPINQIMTVADALSYMDADEGDCITNLDGGFAVYTDGEWIGSLETLNPGAGYLYKSANSKSFIYNNVPTVLNANALYGHRLEPKSMPWNVDKHRYPNLMPVIAQIQNQDGMPSDSIYYVGVFAGDECRGVGKYEDGIMYLSVYGDENRELTFKSWNAETESVYSFAESLSFIPDVVGTIESPFTLNIDFAPSGINQLKTIIDVDGIYNLQGVKINSMPTSGIYLIKTIDADGNSVMKKNYVK